MSTVNDIINQVNRLSGYRITGSLNATGSDSTTPGTISTEGIYPGAIIKSDQVLRIIRALDGTATDTIIISGSLLTSGSNVLRGTTTLSGSLAVNFVSESQFLYVTGGLVKGTNDVPSSSFATSASYAATSSLPLLGIVTASVASTTITFTKGDQTTFDIVISQSGSIESASYALYAENAGTASYVQTAQTASYLANATVANEAARYTLGPANIYPGLLVYQQDVRLTFLLVDTANAANANGWMTMLTGGSSVSSSQTISGSLTVLGSITGSLFGTSSYALTASYALNASTPFSITTGSVIAQVNVDPSSLFLIKSDSTRLLNINNEGVLMLNQLSSAPTAVTGGLYFDTSGNFFVGL